MKQIKNFKYHIFQLEYMHILNELLKEITKKPKNWFMDIFVGYYLLEFLYWIGTFVKSIIPLINRFYFRLAKERNVSCDISYKIFNFDCLFKQYAFECAIPKLIFKHYI